MLLHFPAVALPCNLNLCKVGAVEKDLPHIQVADETLTGHEGLKQMSHGMPHIIKISEERFNIENKTPINKVIFKKIYVRHVD